MKCSFKACTNKYYAKRYCRNHYRQRMGESATRWQVIRDDPILYKHYKDLQKKWSHENPRDYKKHSDQIYFGGFREKAILRDGEICVDCKMTRAEHYARWNIDLHVNHIDHTKLNSMENLETLCVRCHASKAHYKKR